MAARVLITGKGGKSGSWQIRAEQLGEAIGAEIQPFAEVSDCKSADLVVVVKRTPQQLIDNIRRSGRPWVLDIVDGWPQPSTWGEQEAKAWLRSLLADLKPTAVVFGTPQMQKDAEFEGSSIVLPHHSWQRYVDRDPVVRYQIQTVGYEGAERYLGKWRRELRRQCELRGWNLMVNGDMAQADIGVALRDGGGYPARWWKPGTKLSNLHALGIPALLNHEAGYHDVACGCEFWIDDPDDIRQAFDMLSDLDCRVAVCTSMRDAMLPVEHVARRYKTWLTNIAR